MNQSSWEALMEHLGSKEPYLAFVDGHPEDFRYVKTDLQEKPVLHAISAAFGGIERALNEAKYLIERMPLEGKEGVYELLDGVGDHAYEAFRHLVYGEPMERWVRSEGGPGNRLPGGIGDATRPEDVDPDELSRGVEHEMEHTKDPKVAMEIALDHLTEDPRYYSHLGEEE